MLSRARDVQCVTLTALFRQHTQPLEVMQQRFLDLSESTKMITCHVLGLCDVHRVAYKDWFPAVLRM